ncbi:MAG: hypothetical protein JO334_15620 [Verrucomicrobia bacterium]|nr:hypothetical protein [Verrucomicrobiota bacterium]
MPLVETAEVYWQALTIDVPFQNYETNALIRAALSDLNAFSHPLGSSPAGKITARTLFRGETVGDLIVPTSASSFGSTFRTVSKPSTNAIASLSAIKNS